MNKFIESILPNSLRSEKNMEQEERYKLLCSISDNDIGIRVVRDILKSNLEQEFFAAIDPNAPDSQRIRACDGLRVHYYALKQLEEEKERALEWARNRK